MNGRTDGMAHESAPPVTRWLREQKRVTHASIRKIAEYTGVSPDTIKKILDGVTTRPEPETLWKLADYFHFPREQLMELAGYVPEGAFPPIPANIRAMSAEQVMELIPEEQRDEAFAMRSQFRTKEGWEWALRILAVDIMQAGTRKKREGPRAHTRSPWGSQN